MTESGSDPKGLPVVRVTTAFESPNDGTEGEEEEQCLPEFDGDNNHQEGGTTTSAVSGTGTQDRSLQGMTLHWSSSDLYHRPQNPFGNGWSDSRQPFISQIDGNVTVEVVVGQAGPGYLR